MRALPESNGTHPVASNNQPAPGDNTADPQI